MAMDPGTAAALAQGGLGILKGLFGDDSGGGGGGGSGGAGGMGGINWGQMLGDFGIGALEGGIPWIGSLFGGGPDPIHPNQSAADQWWRNLLAGEASRRFSDIPQETPYGSVRFVGKPGDARI